MTKMSPSEALIETLLAHKVEYVFGIVGSALLDFLDIFEPAGLRFIGVQHEQGAAHMADGYARVSGKHGVCIGQNGPGVTNLITGVAAAYWAHSPVFCITPEAGSSTAGLGGFQEIEQMPFFEKITKFQHHLVRSERIAEFTARCLDRALLERGPTQLNIPRDLFYQEVDVTIPAPRPIADPTGSPREIARAVELIAQAKFPVVLVGGGVIWGNASKQVQELVDLIGAPVVTQYLHNDAFPASHPLMCGPIGYQGSLAAMNVLKNADLVIAVGSRLGPFGKVPQYDTDFWPKSAKFIQIDIDQKMLALTQPVDVAIWGGAAEVTSSLANTLKTLAAPIASAATKKDRAEFVRRAKQEWREALDKLTESAPAGELSPRRALRALQKALPKNAIVATDTGNIASTASAYLEFENPKSLLAAMSWGNCGVALPTAMGAKVAAPDRPVIAYVGDGAWGMSMHEVLTCVRERIPIVAVVFNNRQWGAEKRNQMNFYGERFVGTILDNPSFAAIARAMGANGISVSSVDELGDALRSAIASKVVSVIEVPVSRELAEPFRRDALKKPVRKLDKYRKYALAESY